jgi:hypothetical protein
MPPAFQYELPVANAATDPDPIASPATVPYAKLIKVAAQAPSEDRSSVVGLLFSLRGAAAETVTVSLYVAEEDTFDQNADGTLKSVAGTKFHLIKAALVVTANTISQETNNVPPRGVIYVRVTAETVAADRELLIQPVVR